MLLQAQLKASTNYAEKTCTYNFSLLLSIYIAGLDYIPGIMNLVTFQPPGDSVVCTRFEIIDDMIALENNETFVVHFGNNQTTVTILDNDGMYGNMCTTPCIPNQMSCVYC